MLFSSSFLRILRSQPSLGWDGDDEYEDDDGDDGKKGGKEQDDAKSMKFTGIFLAAVSGLFFTLCSVTVKMLPRIDPAEVLFFRAVVQFVLIIPLLALAKSNPLGPKGVRLLVYLQVKNNLSGLSNQLNVC